MTARFVSIKCVRTILALLHPYAPFISEELWSYFKEDGERDLMVSSWPVMANELVDKNTESDMELLKDMVTAIRSIRSRMNVPPLKIAELIVRCSEDKETFIKNHLVLLQALTKIDKPKFGKSIKKPDQSATAVVHGMELYIPLGGLVDLNQERERMEKREAEIQKLISGINGKLSNKNFVNRAPDHVVNHERSKLDSLTEELEKVTTNLETLQ